MGNHRFELIDLSSAVQSSEIRAAWERLLETQEHPEVVGSSRAWAEYLAALGVRIQVVVVRDGNGSVVGLVPVQCHPVGLPHSIGSRTLAQTSFHAADALGGALLVPDDAALKRALAGFMFAAFPRCDAVVLDSLPADDAYFALGRDSSSGFLGYLPSPLRQAYLLELERSFDDYLQQLRPKLRNNAQQSVRRLREAGKGRLELTRYRTPEDADAFFAEANRVRARSWQFASLGRLEDDPRTTRAGLTELARQRLLRSYVLRSGDDPCAFAIGYQDRGVYSYGVIGYDLRFSRYSPGTALLYLLLEDLFLVDKPRRVTFGKGDEEYKRRFSNQRREVGSYLLFRRTWRNSLRVRGHRLFMEGVRRLTRERRHAL